MNPVVALQIHDQKLLSNYGLVGLRKACLNTTKPEPSLGLAELALQYSLIAATAIARNLIVVTRNVQGIERCQAFVYNPWDDAYKM
ncbi:hypothetical protein NNL21_15000 [Paenibacillus mendelii]|nr:hypothetical protein [Paenibacillus mendelii]